MPDVLQIFTDEDVTSRGQCSHRLRNRMSGLVGRNLRLVVERQSDIVQSMQEAVTDELIDLEVCQKTLLIANLAVLQVNGEMVSVNFPCPPHGFSDIVFAQDHGQEAVLAAIVGENISKRWRDDGAETKVAKRPHCMLA